MDNQYNNPEDWTTSELFDHLIGSSIIHPDDKFEDWMHDRADMVKMVKEDIENNQ